jgi:hypothetical protein
MCKYQPILYVIHTIHSIKLKTYSNIALQYRISQITFLAMIQREKKYLLQD